MVAQADRTRERRPYPEWGREVKTLDRILLPYAASDSTAKRL
jgi:hypothetical protein